MTSADDKLVALAERLLERTENGQTKWQETDQVNRFTTTLSNGSVSVERDSRGHHRIAVLNANGVVLEQLSVSPEIIDMFKLMSEAEKALKDKLPRLYGLARRQALGVEEALDSILEELG